MADLLNIGTSGLLAYKTRSEIVQRNITNVNSEYYHRQSIQQIPDMEQYLAPYYKAALVGNGVDASQLNRFISEQLEKELQFGNAHYARYETLAIYSQELDRSVSILGNGITSSINNMHEFMSSLQQDPSQDSMRYSLLSESQIMAKTIDLVHDEYQMIHERIDNEMQQNLLNLNQIFLGVAALNESLMGAPQLDYVLQDKRDQFVHEINDYAGVHALVDPKEGTIQVMLANSVTVVDKKFAASLKLVPRRDDPRFMDVSVKFNNSTERLPLKSLDGKMKGLATYKEEVLEPTIEHLDVLALQVSAQLNHIQQKGFTKSGNIPKAWFSELNQPEMMPQRAYAMLTNGGHGEIEQVLIQDIPNLYSSEPNLDRPNVTDIVGHTFKLKVITPPEVQKTTPLGEPPKLTDTVTQGEFEILNMDTGQLETFYFPQPDKTQPNQLKPGHTPTAYQYKDMLSQNLFKHPTNDLVAMNFQGFNVVLNDASDYALKQYDRFIIRPHSGFTKHFRTQLKDSNELSIAGGLKYEFTPSSVASTEQPGRATPVIRVMDIDRNTLLQKKYLTDGNQLRIRYNKGSSGITTAVNHHLEIEVIDKNGNLVTNLEQSSGQFDSIDLKIPSSVPLDDPTLGLSVDPPFQFKAFGITFALESNQLVAPTGTVTDPDTFLYQIKHDHNSNESVKEMSTTLVTPKIKYLPEESIQFTFIDFFEYRKTEVGAQALCIKSQFEFSTAHRKYLSERVSGEIGVNLDEEGADMVKFEQAYKAAARMISTSAQLIQSLLEVM
jgi:flagellar hook-associated protein FlgK